MREITDHKVNGLNEALKIEVTDAPGQGGASHHYCISFERNSVLVVTDILFQNGPIKEAGINGISQEALLAIVADRLRSFQSWPFNTRENAIALIHVETALLWLQKRTHDRMRRGVEGTTAK